LSEDTNGARFGAGIGRAPAPPRKKAFSLTGHDPS
jgi:hypothetical protein